MSGLQKAIHAFFTDKHGRVVLAQRPNLPLWTAGTAWLLRLVDNGRLERLGELIFYGAIFTWAWLEITSGATLFRRVLGAIVIVWVVWSRLSL